MEEINDEDIKTMQYLLSGINLGNYDFEAMLVEDELAKFVPPWLLKKNYQPKFDPKTILSYMATKNSNLKVMHSDICLMIQICTERGNNLEKIALNSSPELKNELRRLRSKYILVSKAKNSKSAITLSRISEAYPILSCSYLKKGAKNPIVSFDLMESICKNYPRVMMTSAFAYLIPNKEDEFCLFLKKAHLLHQFHFLYRITPMSLGVEHRLHSWKTHLDKLIISNIHMRTQAAINGSHIKYDIQIKFLKEHDLIVESENEITVTEEVLEAVKIWDQYNIN